MALKDLTPDLNKLESQLDKLDIALRPLLGDMSETASQLPLLDRAKLYVLTTYALESLLFCKSVTSPLPDRRLTRATAALKLQGVDTQNHPILTELKRVQQYFAKIKAIEEPPAPPEPRNVSLNTEAAARVIKAGVVWPSPVAPESGAADADTECRDAGQQQQGTARPTGGADCKGARQSAAQIPRGRQRRKVEAR